LVGTNKIGPAIAGPFSVLQILNTAELKSNMKEDAGQVTPSNFHML
jgi:hypothetical protein